MGSKTKSWRPFLVVALKTQAKTTKLTTPTLQKNAPLYNCLLILLLHTAAVSKDLGGKAQVWGAMPQRKTAPDACYHRLDVTEREQHRRIGAGGRHDMSRGREVWCTTRHGESVSRRICINKKRRRFRRRLSKLITDALRISSRHLLVDPSCTGAGLLSTAGYVRSAPIVSRRQMIGTS